MNRHAAKVMVMTVLNSASGYASMRDVHLWLKPLLSQLEVEMAARMLERDGKVRFEEMCGESFVRLA